MSQKDSYIVAASKRKFPFDNILATPATTLQVSLYGKEAMANTATLAVSWTSTTRQGTADNWSPINKGAPKSAAEGLLMFEFDSFGGSCCTTGTLATCANCDLAGT